MAKFKKWDEYVRDRDSGTVNESAAHETTPASNSVTGENLDFSYRDESEYKKLLDFLRGKKNAPQVTEKPQAPKESPKGWFVVDEQSRGFWVNGSWSQDTELASKGIIDSEQAASELAKVIGGVAIPAEEILG